MPAISTRRGSIWVAHQRARGKPVLLLIHGAGSNRLQWPGELRRFPGVELVAVDLPGHDRSPGPPRTTIDDYADDIAALLDALGVERALLAGHSMGGAIALTVALRYPERVRGLALLATGAKLSVAPDLLHADDESAARALVERAWGADADPALKLRHQLALHNLESGTLHADLTACNGFDVRDRLGEITAPTLVIAGARDQMTHPKAATFLHDHLPDAALVTLPAGHMVMLEQPQAVAAALRDWLENRDIA